jgi:hypothetical protein
LWTVSVNARAGTVDEARTAELTQLLLNWQQVLDNRPVAAFVWSDLEAVLAERGTAERTSCGTGWVCTTSTPASAPPGRASTSWCSATRCG